MGLSRQVSSKDTVTGPWVDAGSPITSGGTGHLTCVGFTTPLPKRFYRAIASPS